jgi:thymidine kinase
MELSPSDEQLCIVDACANYNVLVNSVPGSGKTTTILSIIDRYIEQEKSILVLTYNSRLCKETVHKVEDRFDYLSMYVSVHTYHSFSQRTWNIPCHTDNGIKKIVQNNLPMVNDIHYDIVIIDEAQDMTELYYEIYKKVIDESTQIIMLGDEKQSIYQFNGADYRFLSLADKINTISARPFIQLGLSTSYRLSKPIADFINNCIVNKELINPSPYKLEGYPKPTYIIGSFFHEPSHGKKPSPGFKRTTESESIIFVIQMIKDFLNSGYSPNDIFILAPSVKAPQLESDGEPLYSVRPYPSTTQFIALSLQNEIHDLRYNGERVKIFIPSSDDAVLDDDLIEGKIVFCTYHKTKGLERKIVIVCGVDESYQKYYNKGGDPLECSNALYVALTRSAEHLIILHHFKQNYLQFMEPELVEQYVNVKVIKKIDISRQKKDDHIFKKGSPSTITNHMQSDYVEELKLLCKSSVIREEQGEVYLTTKQKDDDNVEQVAEINSFYISLLHNMIASKDKSVFLNGKTNLETGKKYEVDKFVEETENNISIIMNMITKDCLSDPKHPIYSNKNISNLLEYSTYCCGINNGYICKYKQIKRYNWLKYDQISRLLNRLNKVLSNNCIYEEPIQIFNTISEPKKYIELVSKHVNLIIHGIIDIVDHDKKTVWEIKCVQKLKDEHFIQLAIYKYMCLRKNMYTDYKYYLFNIRNGEVHKINANLGELMDMMKYLVDKKYTPMEKNDDQYFINKIISKHQYTLDDNPELDIDVE